VARFRLESYAWGSSVADRCGSYQRGPSCQVPLEHGEPLVLPHHFDHAGSKVGWTKVFHDRVGRQRTHNPGFVESADGHRRIGTSGVLMLYCCITKN
jgi:hypothetical protein